MPQNHLELGKWNALCDICGLKFKSSELRKDWRNLMVCRNDFELRHPQDFLRVRGDTPAVPWTRPDPSPTFVGPACFIWSQSAYADLGTADCMQADFTPLPFLVLAALAGIDFIGHTAIPGLAIPGYAWPGMLL